MPPRRPPVMAKGHATGNDFVLLADPDGAFDLSPAAVAALCDRRFGIGADGLLRAVPTDAMASVPGDDDAHWFMDYRNADGSVAEMCGNGLRLFARFLVRQRLASAGRLRIATRGGVLDVDVPESGDVTVTLGVPTTPRLRAMPVVSVADGGSWHAVGVICPNPHAVAFVDSVDDAGALAVAPEVVPADVFPEGVNVEFVEQVAADHVRMRVHERGVGETLSCGTGAVAVAWAQRRRDGDQEQAPATIRVDVPGGSLLVSELPDGRMTLSGPAEIVADVAPRDAWWSAHIDMV